MEDWQYLSLGDLQKRNFSPKVNIEIFLRHGTDPNNCYDNCMPREVPLQETSKELCVVLWCSSPQCQNVRKWNVEWKYLAVSHKLKVSKTFGCLSPTSSNTIARTFSCAISSSEAIISSSWSDSGLSEWECFSVEARLEKYYWICCSVKN